MHSTSLAYASTTVGWDDPVTEDVLRKLNPKKPNHPWLVAAAWLILCFIASMYNGGLTERQTKSLDAVWRESLPSHERDVDPKIFGFAAKFMRSFIQRKSAPDHVYAETAFIRILAALTPAMMHHCKGQMIDTASGPRPATGEVQMKAQQVLDFCSAGEVGVGLEGAFVDGVLQALGSSLTGCSLETIEESEAAASLSMLEARIRWACRSLSNERTAEWTDSSSNTTYFSDNTKSGMSEVFRGLMTEFSMTLQTLTPEGV